MKRFIKGIAIVSALLMAVTAFTACGNGSSNSSKKDSSSSAQSSKEEVNVHKLLGDNGAVLAEDSKIDINDAEAQAKIEDYMAKNNAEDQEKLLSQEGVTEAKIYAKGNTMVWQVKFLKDLTDEQKVTAKTTFGGIEESFSDLSEARSETGVSNLCVVFVVELNDGSPVYTKVYT